jgi:hypothetical protein
MNKKHDYVLWAFIIVLGLLIASASPIIAIGVLAVIFIVVGDLMP